MKRRWIFVFTLFLLPLQAKVSWEKMDQFIDQARQEWYVPGAVVAVVSDQKVLWMKASGYRNIAKQLPVTSQTLFPIASLSKAFGGFLMGTLVEEGKLSWDKPVRTYLPYFKMNDRKAEKKLAVKDLLLHNSGLSRHDGIWFNKPVTSKDVVEKLAHLESEFPFGEQWFYNQIMYITAGHLMEQVSNKSWSELLNQKVLAPLNMKRTFTSLQRVITDDNHASAYAMRGMSLQEVPLRNIENSGPAGGLNSCVDDLIPWVQMHLNQGKYHGKTILKQEQVKQLHTSHMPMEYDDLFGIEIQGYGYGWMVGNYQKELILFHRGIIEGFSSCICMIPEKKIGIIVLTNLDESVFPKVAVNHLLDALLDCTEYNWHEEKISETKLWLADQAQQSARKELFRQPDTEQTFPLNAYVGEYEHPAYGICEITLNDQGGLEVRVNHLHYGLGHWHYDVFSIKNINGEQLLEGRKVQFIMDKYGHISGIKIPMDAYSKDILFKKKPDARWNDADYLKQFSGSYQLISNSIVIRQTKDGLELSVRGIPSDQLIPIAENRFILRRMPDSLVLFKKDSENKVQEVYVDLPSYLISAKKQVLN